MKLRFFVNIKEGEEEKLLTNYQQKNVAQPQGNACLGRLGLKLKL